MLLLWTALDVHCKAGMVMILRLQRILAPAADQKSSGSGDGAIT